MARELPQNVYRATGACGFDNLALSVREGSRVASSGALHLAGDAGVPRASGTLCPFGLGTPDLFISGLVSLKLPRSREG